jgi:hypothetical protein
MSTATSLSREEHDHAGLIFMRHLGEMTLAMFVGMFAYAFAVGLIAGDAGSSLESARTTEPELFMLGMGSAMSVTMVAWMRHGHHTWRQCGEMTAAMFAPALGVLACYWANAVTANSVCPLSCVLMIPAMAAAMCFRLDLYTAHNRTVATS